MDETVVQLILITYLILVPTVLAFKTERASLTAILVAAGVAALVFTRVSDISSIRLPGLQDTLEQQIGRVQVTIYQLQKLAAATAKANLSELAMSGQIMSRINTEEKFAIRDRVINSLNSIGANDAQIHDAQSIWIDVNCHLLLTQIAGEATKTWSSAVSDIDKLPRDSDYDLPAPQTIIDWAKSISLHSDRLSQLLNEYKLLWTTGSMKDPSIIPFNASLRQLPPS
jgi:hypothetical protein